MQAATDQFLFWDNEEEDDIPDGDGMSACDRGSIAEHLFSMWCMANRIECFAPVNNQGKADRVIKLHGAYHSIQVKSASLRNNRSFTKFAIWPGCTNRKQPKASDADILVCIGMDYYNPEISKSFGAFIPWAKAIEQQSITLKEPLGAWSTPDQIIRMMMPKNVRVGMFS